MILCLKKKCVNIREYSYGENLDPVYCFFHKTDNMVKIKKNFLCLKTPCQHRAIYGYSYSIAKYCFFHKLDNMVNMIPKICRNNLNECTNIANYGHVFNNKLEYCTIHKVKDMVEKVNKEEIYEKIMGNNN